MPPSEVGRQKAARAIRLPGRPRGRSLSVGRRLFAPLQLVGCPFGLCVRRPSTCLRHRCRRSECLPNLSQAFARPGNEKISGAIRYRQLQPLTIPAYRSTDAFSASRIRTLLGPFGSSRSLHRTVSTSDALLVTRRHARVGIRTARSARPCITPPLRVDDAGAFDLRVRGLRIALPVKA